MPAGGWRFLSPLLVEKVPLPALEASEKEIVPPLKNVPLPAVEFPKKRINVIPPELKKPASPAVELSWIPYRHRRTRRPNRWCWQYRITRAGAVEELCDAAWSITGLGAAVSDVSSIPRGRAVCELYRSMLCAVDISRGHKFLRDP